MRRVDTAFEPIVSIGTIPNRPRGDERHTEQFRGRLD